MLGRDGAVFVMKQKKTLLLLCLLIVNFGLFYVSFMASNGEKDFRGKFCRFNCPVVSNLVKMFCHSPVSCASFRRMFPPLCLFQNGRAKKWRTGCEKNILLKKL